MSASSAWLTTASAAVQRRWRGTAQRSGARFQYGTGYVLRYSASRSTVYSAFLPHAAERSGGCLQSPLATLAGMLLRSLPRRRRRARPAAFGGSRWARRAPGSRRAAGRAAPG